MVGPVTTSMDNYIGMQELPRSITVGPHASHNNTESAESPNKIASII